MEAFRKTLEECNLFDMGFNGNWFTWERGNLPETNIQERLDRGVATEEWVQIFPEFQIQHLPHTISDHCPLLINTKKECSARIRKVFKFEAWWVLEDSFFNEVKNIWEHFEEAERDEENLADLIDTKIQMNLEIAKASTDPPP
ncbi:hypothetical protein Golob_005571, partial [Gossypium lobatum]|nr:hypothetical protein [Gossypium lobatum]